MRVGRRLGWWTAPAALLAATAVCAAPVAGSSVSFVACPVARDTGPNTDLCFIAEHDGVAYALINPTDAGNPQLKHRVLVEGRVGAGPAVCGAVPIEGRVSVLAEVDPACDQVLPFDGKVVGVVGGIFNSGPPDQQARMRSLAARANAEPALSIAPVMPDPPPAAAPAPPFAVQTMTIHYGFDSDRGTGPDMLEVTRLAAYANASKAQVRLVSRQGASRLSNGAVMAESSGMARRRAAKLADILFGLGLPRTALSVQAIDKPPAPDGVDDWQDRRIELTVTPAAASSQTKR